jgi:flagellar biosynthesis chaperone FliJ
MILKTNSDLKNHYKKAITERNKREQILLGLLGQKVQLANKKIRQCEDLKTEVKALMLQCDNIEIELDMLEDQKNTMNNPSKN